MMLNKRTVKTQLKEVFKTPVTSTQYIVFRKEHPEFPSYLQLQNLYGSWDQLCLSIWGVGTKHRKWSVEEAKKSVLKAFPESVSSTQYIALRSKEKHPLPTYEVLIELFGNWSNVSQEIWGKKRELFRDWNQLDELKQLILQSFSQPVSSSKYEKERKQQQLDIPSLDTLLRRFQTWEAVRCWLWDQPKVEWTRESIKEIILKEFPTRLSSTVYDVRQKANHQLPIRSTIVRFYGSWKEFSKSVWGEIEELTDEEVLDQIKDIFPSQPNQRIYEEKASRHPKLLSIHHLEKRFGSWNTVIGALYQGKSLEVEQPNRTYNQYSTSQLIRLIQQKFKERPSRAQYEEIRKKDPRLPANSTMATRFGDWTTAMNQCFPESSAPAHANTWTQEQIVSILKQALSDLASLEVITKNDYLDWRNRQSFPTPSRGTIASYFGSFHEGLMVAGYQGGFRKPSKLRARGSRDVEDWMNFYIEQLEGRPSTENYKKFQKKYPEAPTQEYLVRFYGTTWKGVIEQFAEEWSMRTHEIYSDEEIQKALQFVYQSIGIPMTVERYDAFRKTCEMKLPISGSISRRFKNWRNALEVAGIPYMTYNQSSRYQISRVIDYEKEVGAKSLDDLLNWVLDDC